MESRENMIQRIVYPKNQNLASISTFPSLSVQLGFDKGGVFPSPESILRTFLEIATLARPESLIFGKSIKRFKFSAFATFASFDPPVCHFLSIANISGEMSGTPRLTFNTRCITWFVQTFLFHTLTPRTNSLFKSAVIKISSLAQLIYQRLRLLSVRVNAIFVGLAHLHINFTTQERTDAIPLPPKDGSPLAQNRWKPW
jgi:hypothetical protein